VNGRLIRQPTVQCDRTELPSLIEPKQKTPTAEVRWALVPPSTWEASAVLDRGVGAALSVRGRHEPPGDCAAIGAAGAATAGSLAQPSKSTLSEHPGSILLNSKFRLGDCAPAYRSTHAFAGKSDDIQSATVAAKAIL